MAVNNVPAPLPAADLSTIIPIDEVLNDSRKKFSVQALQGTAVSIVMPMYNSEKYIADTLENVLAQTFQNYEVILVNDCSTDDSRPIAENYLEKFGGRLNIYDNEKNLGVSASRNRGLIFSRGEYIFFVDADDIITPNALEDLYWLAKNFDVDFVHGTERNNLSEDAKKITREIPAPQIIPDDIILVENDLNWRIDSIMNFRFKSGSWRKFVKRNFLLENNLFFQEDVRFAEDHIWTYALFLCAGKIVHVPRTFYYCRASENSLVRTKKTPIQRVNQWVSVLVNGIKWIDDVMGKRDFFRENPKIRHAMLERLSRRYSREILINGRKLQQFELYETIKQEFSKDWGKQDVLIAELFTLINTYQKRIIKLEEQLKNK